MTHESVNQTWFSCRYLVPYIHKDSILFFFLAAFCLFSYFDSFGDLMLVLHNMIHDSVNQTWFSFRYLVRYIHKDSILCQLGFFSDRFLFLLVRLIRFIWRFNSIQDKALLVLHNMIHDSMSQKDSCIHFIQFIWLLWRTWLYIYQFC